MTGSPLRSEQEIRAEIERLEAYPQGSNEELAGATAALRWVLLEEEYTVVNWDGDAASA